MDATLRQQLKALEEAHINIEVRKDFEKLGDILADDFFEIGSSGHFYDKQDCLDSGGVVLMEMTLHDYQIYPLATDVVMSTYFIEDTTRKRNTLRSSIWKRIDDRWQLYFHQGTITPMQLDEFSKE